MNESQREQKRNAHLSGMLDADEALYEQILDTPGFAYHFNELCKLAAAPDKDAEPEESPAEWLQRLGMDGREWAREFRKRAVGLGYSDMDEGWLVGWFANAIMAGFDEGQRRAAGGSTRRSTGR